MKIDLSGELAVVTGSTESIGFAVARARAKAGAEVVINSRSAEKVDAAVTRVGGAARGVVPIWACWKAPAAPVAAVAAPDIVISNAGIFQPADFFDTDDAIWDRRWQVNVMAGVRLARVWLEGMAARGWDRLILLGSESSFNIPVDMIHYGVSKTADVALARGVAKRMAGTGVTVNAVLPGPTLSEGVAAMLAEEQARSGKGVDEVAPEFVVSHRPSSIIRRAASVEEVASMIVYAASPQASATTGAALRVDGGVIDSLQ